MIIGKRSSGPQDWPPAPPDGYRFCSPSLPLFARILVGLWVPLSFFALVALIIVIHGPVGSLRLLGLLISQGLANYPLYVVSVLSLVALMIVVHELLHLLPTLLLGYTVNVEARRVDSWLDWRFILIPFGEFQSRFDTLVIAVAPLVLVTPVGIAALASGSAVLAGAASLLLTVNTLGAVADIETVLLMLALPPGALVRHDSAGREQNYVPEKSG